MHLNTIRLLFLSAICASLAFCSAGCFLFEKTESKIENANEESSFEIPRSGIDLAKPIEYSKAAKDLEKCSQIKKTIEESEFKNARWGLIAIGLKDGRAVCGIDAQKLFNPASIQKLLTSIVALDKLGAGFRSKTSVYSKTGLKDGILDGDITLYGRGSADLDNEGLAKLASQLNQKGIKQIKGDVIGDESYFKGDRLGDGWTWNEAQWYYGAAASALTINENMVTVTLEKGKPKADSNFVELSGEVNPIEDLEAIGLKRELGTNKIYVWGNGNSLKARVAVDRPAFLAAKIFKEILEKNGISVDGEAKMADWKSAKKLDAENANEIASLSSQTLAELIRKMNKDSVNLYAELMLRNLGKKYGDEAPDENPKMQKLRGVDSAGASFIKKWLGDKNISTNEIAIHDGSGLSRLDLVTPEVFARALVYASQADFSGVFKSSLPIAGQSGTLKGRLGNVRGHILAKTGSITYAHSLAGYANSSDETFAFAIICNNETRKAESSVVIDKIASLLVSN
ncbi:MAG: D-alanyl-D-alanine carboxypeptidase/D-alanyl-D-alanine-endopeptidase [Pyrinomonadaceae bacterium]|nr:D-alanyl-D-alanine carboxypeptidase/D-alanyl-D-alanine-endopeptidase [Pyrinomonadaceae bacterium]